MSINKQNVSNRLFDILVGTGHAIVMGDEDGAKTLNPNDAVRFYIKNKHSMVYYDRKASLLKLSVGNNQRYEDVKDLIDAIKQTATHYVLGVTVKNYGKKLEPKDFAFQVTESTVTMAGTTRSSYQRMESAKLIIRHTKAVNEEIRGARSRSIHSIFIENAAGERFAYPFKYLAGARAVARHVSEGGYPYDEQGQRLIKLAEQYIALRKFAAHAHRSNFINEDTSRLVELAEARADQISHAMKSGRGLSEMTAGVGIDDPDRLTQAHSIFTKKTVNAAVESAMPYVLELLDQQQLKESSDNGLIELTAAIDAFPTVEISKMDDSDPNHPKNLEFSGSDIRNKHVAEYLVKHMVNADLRAKVQQLMDNYSSYESQQKDTVVELLRNLIRKAKVINNEQVTRPSVSNDVLSSISEEISKYTASTILAK